MVRPALAYRRLTVSPLYPGSLRDEVSKGDLIVCPWIEISVDTVTASKFIFRPGNAGIVAPDYSVSVHGIDRITIVCQFVYLYAGMKNSVIKLLNFEKGSTSRKQAIFLNHMI